MYKKIIYYAFASILTIAIFVIISNVSQEYSYLLKSLVNKTGIWGILSYILIMITSIVIVPIGSGFLLPIAANTWGNIPAAIYSITGWTIGSIIAFYISRNYGYKFLKKFKMVQKVRMFENMIPKHNLFIIVILLRIALPVDVLSYALGIFSSMGYWPFLLSTIIGVSPFAFMFSYASTSSTQMQILVSVAGTIVFFIGTYYVYIKRRGSRMNKNRNETE